MGIEELAKMAGFTVASGSYGLRFSGGDVEKLARLAAEAECVACAAYVEQFGKMKGLREVCNAMADGIRMRSNV